MDDTQWITHLQGRMAGAGWTPVGPDRSGTGWIAGAARFDPAGTGVSGPADSGPTAVAAVEKLYGQIVGELPQRPDEPRESDHELDGIPDQDLHELRTIRADFHRHGLNLSWSHPTAEVWVMRWTPHGDEVEEAGEYRGHDMTALEAARHAWERFGASRGGG